MWGSHGVTGLLIRLIIIVTLVTSDADANHLRKRATTDRRKRKCIFNENFPLVLTECMQSTCILAGFCFKRVAIHSIGLLRISAGFFLFFFVKRF